MPDDVRLSIYATMVAVLGVVTAVLAADGSWVLAATTLCGATVNLMSALYTWRRRGWTPDETTMITDPGPDE